VSSMKREPTAEEREKIGVSELVNVLLDWPLTQIVDHHDSGLHTRTVRERSTSETLSEQQPRQIYRIKNGTAAIWIIRKAAWTTVHSSAISQ